MLRPPEPQFLLGMRAVRLVVGRDADLFQQKTRRAVQQPVEWIQREIKPLQRIRRPKRDGQRFLDRQPFRREFADGDVKKSQRAETDGE